MSEKLTAYKQLEPAEDGPSKKELREYSKGQDAAYLEKYGQPRYNSREAIAREALRLRRQNQELGKRATEESRRIESKQEELAGYKVDRGMIGEERLSVEQGLAEIEIQLQDYETKLVKRVMAALRPTRTKEAKATLGAEYLDYENRKGRLEVDLAIKDGSIGLVNQELAYLQGELGRIYEWKAQSKNDAARYIDDYYDMQAKSLEYDKKIDQERLNLEEYKQEQGSVEAQILARGHYLVHGITPEFLPGFRNNRMINNQSFWSDRMAFALLEQPTMSTSSFSPEGGAVGLWSQFGLVLSGGTVESASTDDAGTVVDKKGVRHHSLAAQDVEQYQKDINRSLIAGSSRKYNEIITSSPRSTAAYICLDRWKLDDDLGGKISKDRLLMDREDYGIAVGDIVQYASDYNLPLVLFEQGQGYLAEVDEAAEAISKGRKISPQEIAEWQWQPPEDMNLEEAASRVRGSVLAIV